MSASHDKGIGDDMQTRHTVSCKQTLAGPPANLNRLL